MSSKRTHSRFDRARATVRRAAFESLYGQFAWAYDWVSRTFFLRQWRVWQRAALPHLRGKRILEVGMGTGNLQIDLRMRGYEAYGADLSPQMLRQASAKAKRSGMPPFRAVRARAQSLPFAGGQFSSLVSTFPSDYISEPGTLHELWRVLEPGGRLVIVPSGRLYPRGTRGKTLEGFARLVYGDNQGGAGAPVLESSSLDLQATPKPESPGWSSELQHRMKRAGFGILTYTATNSVGETLIVVGEKGYT